MAERPRERPERLRKPEGTEGEAKRPLPPWPPRCRQLRIQPTACHTQAPQSWPRSRVACQHKVSWRVRLRCTTHASWTRPCNLCHGTYHRIALHPKATNTTQVNILRPQFQNDVPHDAAVQQDARPYEVLRHIDVRHLHNSTYGTSPIRITADDIVGLGSTLGDSTRGVATHHNMSARRRCALTETYVIEDKPTHAHLHAPLCVASPAQLPHGPLLST